MADTPTPPVPTPVPAPTPPPPPPPEPPPYGPYTPYFSINRRLRILAVPLWWLAKPRPPAYDPHALILSTIFRDFPADTAFTGQDQVNIYTQSRDYVVTHPSFEEFEEGTDYPVFRPTWHNIRAALLYPGA